jgi:thiol-disulfide isomerase/thioredoxin
MARLLTLLIIALSFWSISAWAQSPPASAGAAKTSDLNGAAKPERGWFFFDDPKPKPPEEEKEPPPLPEIAPAKAPPPPKEDKCKKKDTWTPDCGFVNPGTDFQFQAKQRDALMEQMSVAKNDPKAVEAFQYYMRWVVERTAEATNMWWYNMVQNPELDPSVQSPVSAFGLRLMTEVQKGKDKEIFDLVKAEGGFFVYFSRSDCNFCHQMAPTLQDLSKKSGIPIRNASLDGKCMPGFTEGCMTTPATDAPARALQVATVPAVFLYIPKATWLRVSTGVVDLESMMTRTVQFFQAYRSAMLKGVENSQKGRPSVDFSAALAGGASEGAEGAKAGADVTMPSEDDIAKLLGAGKAK